MARITKRTVDAAKPEEKRYTIFDEDVRGFGLRVYPTGAKSYIFEYRAKGGGRAANKERITIGKVGDLTPDQARKMADHYRTAVKTNGDPQREKTEWRKSMTVEQVATEFLEHIAAARSENTYSSYESVLRVHFMPVLGKRKARDVTHADMERLRLSLKGMPATANKLLRVVSSMYTYAENRARAWVPKGTNPTADIEFFVEHERKVEFSDEEMARLGESLRIAETEGVPWSLNDSGKVKHRRKDAAEQLTIIDPAAAAGLRLLMFTGARLREILHLRWEDVRLDQNLITIRGHKTARQVGDKTIVLNGPARAILEELALTRRGVYVIAGETAGQDDERPRSDLNRPWNAVRRHAGMDGLRIHDLRHIFASIGVAGNMALPLIGKLLGHASVQSTQRYAYLQRNPQRQAADRIGRVLSKALGPAAPKRPSKSKRTRASAS